MESVVLIDALIVAAIKRVTGDGEGPLVGGESGNASFGDIVIGIGKVSPFRPGAENTDFSAPIPNTWIRG